jgi:pimeloyl-ACP methyl ester carboxylesterase
MRRSEFQALAGAALSGALLAPRAPAAAPAVARPAPAVLAPGFDEARAQARALIARDNADDTLIEAALPRLYEHGRPAGDAVLLLHGFTNCPQQFDELAQRFYRRGCNVYVPRVPYHGKKDRLTNALESLTEADLSTCALESYQIARGLGRRVSAVGLSMGGSMSVWLAQNTPIDLAVPVAPFLMPVGIPGPIGMLAMHLIHALPNSYWWWDPHVKADTKPIYAYPGFPSYSLCELVFFGWHVIEAARQRQPLGKTCTFILNSHESAVNNNVARRLLDAWKEHDQAAFREIVLTSLGPPPVHDIIDPTTYPQGRTLVYPHLEQIVLGS